MGVLEAFGSVLLAAGCLLALTGSVGVLRMPDFYSRLHPAGKTDTLGQLLMLSGLMLFAGQQILTLLLAEGGPDESAALSSSVLGWANIILKVLLVSALLFVTAPTSTHAIAKAARLDHHTVIFVDGDPRNVEGGPADAINSEGEGERERGGERDALVHPVAVEDDVTRRLDPPEQEEPR